MASELVGIESMGGQVIDKWKINLDKGVPAYQIMYTDPKGSLFNAPSVVMDTFFVYKNMFYLFTAMVGNDGTRVEYMQMYDNFFQALEFE